MGLAFSFESHHSPLPSSLPSGFQHTIYLLWRLLLIKQVQLPFLLLQFFFFFFSSFPFFFHRTMLDFEDELCHQGLLADLVAFAVSLSLVDGSTTGGLGNDSEISSGVAGGGGIGTAGMKAKTYPMLRLSRPRESLFVFIVLERGWLHASS
jgi:hypothetical protein